MVHTIDGNLDAKDLRFGVVASQFNSLVSEQLKTGALDALARHGARDNDVDVVLVPGAFDIPLFAKEMAGSGRYDSIVCIGAIIKGETPHFEYISAAVTQGIKEISLSTGVPLAFGVLTTDTLDQAFNRAGAKLGNKGWEAALSAIEMARALKALRAIE